MRINYKQRKKEKPFIVGDHPYIATQVEGKNIVFSAATIVSRSITGLFRLRLLNDGEYLTNVKPEQLWRSKPCLKPR